jgi:thioesterase domain-containing protein
MTSTPDNGEQARHLEQVIHGAIPLSKAMDLHVIHLSANSICLEAPVADANINIHGTGFAGSIYSVCALSAWSLMYNRLLIEKVSGDVVVAHAEIQYLLPVRKSIRAECLLEDQQYDAFHQRLLQKGKASLGITVQVKENDKLKATLDARVAVIMTTVENPTTK